VVNVHGYQPSSVRLRTGIPARLTFIRKVEQTCGREIVIPGYGFCSFAALVYERPGDDRALVEKAQIVQAADSKDQLDSHPAARGLRVDQPRFSAGDA
jgi:hypothetical protein